MQFRFHNGPQDYYVSFQTDIYMCIYISLYVFGIHLLKYATMRFLDLISH